LGLLFFQNPIYLALTLIGASLPDFDHEFRENKVYMLIITGIGISGILYLLNLPYFFGIMICLLAIIFYFSSHRGFTHSIFGISILTVLIVLILVLGSFTLVSLKLELVNVFEIGIVIIILFLGILFLHRKLILPFLTLFLLGIMFLETFPVNYIMMVFSIFLGFLSHLILDSFTPSGVKILIPFSTRKFHGNFGIIMLFLLGILLIPQFIQVLTVFNIF